MACTGSRVGPVGSQLTRGPRARLALFPVENLSGGAAPLGELHQELENALRARGLDVMSGAGIERFLANRRIRYTGGLDTASAIAANSDLGVDGVIITSIESYRLAPPPQLALTMRLVSAADPPTILWIDAVSLSGNDAPGLLNTGLIQDPRVIEAMALDKLATSLALYVEGRGPRATACPVEQRFMPRSFTASPADELSTRSGKRLSVAIMPFRNESTRRNANAVIALELARELQATDRFDVVEPGVVREQLLRYRIMLDRGVSLDTARIALDVLQADLILAGRVFTYEDEAGTQGVPTAGFAVLMLDRNLDEITFQSTSLSRGDDHVYFFGLGRVANVGALSCRMSSAIVDLLLRGDQNDESSQFDMSESQNFAFTRARAGVFP